LEGKDTPWNERFEARKEETSMSEKKKKKSRVKVGNLSREQKELAGHQAANIKGGSGNAGAGGGDVRSITQLKSN
jgi:hypothetical protein